jgi:hypothetical protein
MDRVLAEATMVAHFAYLALVVFGGFLAWHWPRMLVAHLMATACGVVIVAASLNCPLTFIEDRLRRGAGQPGLPRGFIDTYIEGALYPARYAGQVRMLAAGLIVLSWLGVFLIQRRRPMSMPGCI